MDTKLHIQYDDGSDKIIGKNHMKMLTGNMKGGCIIGDSSHSVFLFFYNVGIVF